MHLILTYLLVTMLLGYVTGSEVQDLSDFCTQDRIHNNYLTFGMGYSDSLVSILKSKSSFNCILSYADKAKNYIMLVLEFPELKPKERVCVSRKVSDNLVTVSDYNEKKNCQYTGSDPVYRSLSLEKTTIHLNTLGNLNKVKITATSMKGLQGNQCLEANETQCAFAEKFYCMTKKVACDGHNNCGVPNVYDEDISTCRGRSLTFLMKATSFLMGILTIFLFGSICLTVLPKRKETFVYKADEAVSSCDSEGEILSTEVDIQILFPEYYK